MIDRQLRPIGEAIRFVWPSFSERKFKFCNFILKNFGRGADVTPWKIKCEQIKIPRADGSELRLCVYSNVSLMGSVACLSFSGGFDAE